MSARPPSWMTSPSMKAGRSWCRIKGRNSSRYKSRFVHTKNTCFTNQFEAPAPCQLNDLGFLKYLCCVFLKPLRSGTAGLLFLSQLVSNSRKSLTGSLICLYQTVSTERWRLLQRTALPPLLPLLFPTLQRWPNQPPRSLRLQMELPRLASSTA
jgi:hypothetical protein